MFKLPITIPRTYVWLCHCCTELGTMRRVRLNYVLHFRSFKTKPKMHRQIFMYIIFMSMRGFHCWAIAHLIFVMQVMVSMVGLNGIFSTPKDQNCWYVGFESREDCFENFMFWFLFICETHLWELSMWIFLIPQEILSTDEKFRFCWFLLLWMLSKARSSGNLLESLTSRLIFAFGEYEDSEHSTLASAKRKIERERKIWWWCGNDCWGKSF